MTKQYQRDAWQGGPALEFKDEGGGETEECGWFQGDGGGGMRVVEHAFGSGGGCSLGGERWRLLIRLLTHSLIPAGGGGYSASQLCFGPGALAPLLLRPWSQS